MDGKLYILVGPTCRGPTPVYASSLLYKRETPVREGLGPKGSRAGQRIDSFILSTPHSGCRVLRSGGPNHSKSVCSCVLAPELDRPNSLALPPSTPPRGNRRVRSATQHWVPPKAHDKAKPCILFCLAPCESVSLLDQGGLYQC